MHGRVCTVSQDLGHLLRLLGALGASPLVLLLPPSLGSIARNPPHEFSECWRHSAK